MVKREEASEPDEAVVDDDTLLWGNRWTTIQRKPAFTVYLTLLCSAGPTGFSRFTACAIVARLMAAAEAILSRAVADAAAAAAAALAPDNQ